MATKKYPLPIVLRSDLPSNVKNSDVYGYGYLATVSTSGTARWYLGSTANLEAVQGKLWVGYLHNPSTDAGTIYFLSFEHIDAANVSLFRNSVSQDPTETINSWQGATWGSTAFREIAPGVWGLSPWTTDYYHFLPTIQPEGFINWIYGESLSELAFNFKQQAYIPTDDPYGPGGDSEPGGGDGTFDFESTPIDFQGLPTIGAMATGMVSLYVPSSAQLAALAGYLWAGAFDPDNFKKLFADPMDAIIGLQIVPVTAAEIGVSSATLAVGNISTGLSMPLATRQYVSVDCGSISVLPKWGAYLDYAPYSKLQLFLPYIGFVDISPDDCMNGTIAVKYSVDILGGTCTAQVKCNNHVLYEYSGSCSCQCPVTAGQYQNIALGALRLAGAAASAATGNVLGAASEAASAAIATVKPEIQRSGGIGGSAGLMGHQIPFLVLTIPKMCTPKDQHKQIGYPSFVTAIIGDLEGYIRVDTIHLTGIPGATLEDMDEIAQLLQGGVYV